MYKLGVDVGGTFTDLILVNEEKNEVVVHKIPSTPTDPSQAVVQGMLEITTLAGIQPNEIKQFFHGTTVATNIVLEHNGADVGLITTEGFRDILHIARHKRPLNFSIYQDLPWQKYPLVKRRNRLTVKERIVADGSVRIPLDEEAVRQQVRLLKERKVEAIAVCFLFSFKNAEHEEKVKKIISEEYPEVYLSLSSEVLPQYREYERFSTVALNAFVGPKTSKYISRLKDSLITYGVDSKLHLMQSNGGISTADSAQKKPVNLLLSGPVGGVIGGKEAAERAGFNNIITLDIGGTSADIGVIPNGELRVRHLLDTKIGDYNAMVPMIEVDAIGAGGGSIAYIDNGGIFRVGPQSAGADPGPVSYGKGGIYPTSTDANVLLGRIQPSIALAGNLTLNPKLAEEAFETHICSKLAMTPLEAAASTLKIMTHNMVNAIELNSVRKGLDPREFTLVAAGGAGPLFACDIAEELNIPKVVVPPYPGITAAVGLLSSDLNYDHVLTLWSDIHPDNQRIFEESFIKLENDALNMLKEDHISEDKILMKRYCDCRYEGQGYEIRIECPSGPINKNWFEELNNRFHAAHAREYASSFPEKKVIAINIRATGIGIVSNENAISYNTSEQITEGSLNVEHFDVYFWANNKLEKFNTAFYKRDQIHFGTEITGPAIILQNDTTTVVPPDVNAHFDYHGNIILDLETRIKVKQKNLLTQSQI